MGLSSWHISLIRTESQDAFLSIDTLDKLKRVPLGVGSGWSSRSVYELNGFEVVPGSNYEGLFRMLEQRRFDHLPRQINEAFAEIDSFHINSQYLFSNLKVESNFVVHFPVAKYFFVSLGQPKLAERIRIGLESMLRDGSLKEFMLMHNIDLIKRAKLCKRRVFYIDDETLTPQTRAIFRSNAYMYNPFDETERLCKN